MQSHLTQSRLQLQSQRQALQLWHRTLRQPALCIVLIAGLLTFYSDLPRTRCASVSLSVLAVHCLFKTLTESH
jgi:hypothetical protein